MYEVLLELDDLLETLTCWLSFAAVALSVIVVAAYVWHKAAEQKATRAEPRKRKDGMTSNRAKSSRSSSSLCRQTRSFRSSPV